jgi:hypothetical protein
MRDRQQEFKDVHEEGILKDAAPRNFARVRVGSRSLDDSTLNISPFKELPNSQYFDKKYILRALAGKDIKALRRISRAFFMKSGIYSHVCEYLSRIYRYDWYVVPYVKSVDSVSMNKLLKDFSKVLTFFDSSNIKLSCGKMALNLIVDGCYYGYMIPNDECVQIQELPIDYCRSRYDKNGVPTVEFDMKYFDTQFPDSAYRNKVLKVFPQEFSEGYRLYKQGKLSADFMGDSTSWYLLSTDNAFKLNLNNSDVPILVNAIPYLLDVDEARELEKKKMLQKLLKIIIQKLPLDKNSELVFDVEEAQDIHTNAVHMVKNAIGVDILTTFADIETVDLSDSATSVDKDDLGRFEKTAYTELGVAQNLFNSDGNIALEKSVLVDEASVRAIPLTFVAFYNRVIKFIGVDTKKCSFKFNMLETTQFNYKDLAKTYKEQVQYGYSKFLPQLALGHSQSEILALATFENKILNLSEIMVPPQSSNTISSSGSSTGGGRPSLQDDQKSEKTIANIESGS